MMKSFIKRGASLVLGLSLTLSLSIPAAAAAVPYLPDVTEEMTKADFWMDRTQNPNQIMMTYEEIQKVNADTASVSDTVVLDLKSVPPTFDGVYKNSYNSQMARANGEYYLGWTYDSNGKKYEWDFYQSMVDNTQDANARENMAIRYAVAVKRTTIHNFPSNEVILDDPTDPDFDYQNNTGVRVNEPLLVYTTSADGEFYQVRSECSSGWIPVEDVALFHNKEEWLHAWDIPQEDVLVFYGNKLYTAPSNTYPATAKQLITIGTTLRIVDPSTLTGLVNNRSPFHCYTVEYPLRDDNGNYDTGYALIPESAQVRQGYFPLTQSEIAKIAMNTLGDPYGWGGMLGSDDCSELVRNIYACFGLTLPRNTSWQVFTPVANLNLTGMSNEEKRQVFDTLPFGAVLFFSGHEILYLGHLGDKHYVLSDVSKIMDPKDSSRTLRTRTTMINSLDIYRANGQQWMSALTKVILPGYGNAADKSFTFPATPWYHDGVAYCLSNKLLQPLENQDFGVFQEVSRADAAYALWVLAGSPESDVVLSFTDVDSKSATANAICWTAEQQIMMGYNESTFGPNDTLTREQMTAILYRFAKYQQEDITGFDGDLNQFPDGDKVSAYAKDSCLWACGTQILKGNANGKLDPQGTCTRGQLAVILLRFSNLFD